MALNIECKLAGSANQNLENLIKKLRLKHRVFFALKGKTQGIKSECTDNLLY